MSIEAMKQALEALENHTAIKHPQQRHYRDSAIDALRAAIEEAKKQEPVGWVECDGVVVWYNRDAAIGRDLYTTPPQLQAQPNQEPVAWIDANHLQYAMREPSVCRLMPVPGKGYVPLYATLREWEGLTDEDLDIQALWDILAGMNNADGSIVVQFARAIEAKLKEKNT